MKKRFYCVRHGRSVEQREDRKIVFAIDLPEHFTVSLPDGRTYNAQAVTMARWLAADKIVLFHRQFYRLASPCRHRAIRDLIEEFHRNGGPVYDETDAAVPAICRRVLKAVAERDGEVSNG